MAFNGVKVFSATKAREREDLGDNVTRWIRANPNVPNPIARQHSSMPTSAQLRRGDERPQMPIIIPSTAIIAAGGQIAASPAANTPSTTDATVPPIAIIAARRASISSEVEARRGCTTRAIATGATEFAAGPVGGVGPADPPSAGCIGLPTAGSTTIASST